ncbi:MAG: inorganic phosphate transporter [Bacteroidaceae bacterium]|nr:inorganic phosphate transporter [Bacteroidaceae bacterium]
METMFLGIVVFLFLLAIFDLVVGVSNDAVNFLNSAIGSKAASFKLVITVAALGVFFGAALSNGMMEIARHGIFQPEHFYFQELMCIFLAVMVTDVILLDIFNTLGMPTSTTVSMVFELLGGTFVLALIKIAMDETGMLGFGDLLNTEKALSVIIGIFLSVAIAFFFGTIVQYISRIIFTFNYTGRLKYTIGLFGGVAATAIIYFMLIKGLKDSSFMTAENKLWVKENTLMLTTYCFIGFTVLMQILHWCKVNVFKVIVLMGTFALATAFAGNDLVNFIGVPLAGLASFQDFVANGNGDPMGFLMSSLNGPAKTPFIYLFAAGAIMVIALVTSKKAKNVIKTSVDLSRQDEGDEMFGSSGVARSIVRNTMNAGQAIAKFIPEGVKTWADKRFCKDVMVMENGAAFDLVRASVNLVLAGLLIALGTSLKLPLSTTYVTFMVAMGTSLADRAWGRETAVYRITGVLSVIGGWFITAGAAFTICAIVVLIMYYGGFIAMFAMIGLVIFLLIRSERAYSKKQKNEKANDVIFKQLLASQDVKERWSLLRQHVNNNHVDMFDFIMATYTQITDGFINEDIKSLRKAMVRTGEEKQALKKMRRKEIIGLRRIDKFAAIEKNTWFHLGSNSCEQMLYCMKRICEPCKEHVDNNFKPLSERARGEFIPVRDEMIALMTQARDVIISGDYDKADAILKDGDGLKVKISTLRRHQMNRIHDESVNVKTALVYLNILQESQELVSSWRHLLRASRMFQ